jgi:hypothetical protein
MNNKVEASENFDSRAPSSQINSAKTTDRTWKLLGADGQFYRSDVPGTLGGHRAGKRYGLLSCRAALQAIARGGYVKNRVFFLDESAAIAAGYRPCAVCLPKEYSEWKSGQPVKCSKNK